jgi:hypothetical protein
MLKRYPPMSDEEYPLYVREGNKWIVRWNHNRYCIFMYAEGHVYGIGGGCTLSLAEIGSIANFISISPQRINNTPEGWMWSNGALLSQCSSLRKQVDDIINQAMVDIEIEEMLEEAICE